MNKKYMLLSFAVVFLMVLGIFFIDGLCDENNPTPAIKVTQETEASLSSVKDLGKEETTEEREKTKEADKGIFKLGGNEIKLMLIQPQPLFTTELFSVPEEEEKER